MNIIYGGLVAVSQKDLKLMIGYSSSSHMGYVLLGMASLTLVGLEGAVFLMFAHGLMTALAFALIGFFYDQTHTRMADDLGGTDAGHAVHRHLLRHRRHGVRRPARASPTSSAR